MFPTPKPAEPGPSGGRGLPGRARCDRQGRLARWKGSGSAASGCPDGTGLAGRCLTPHRPLRAAATSTLGADVPFNPA